MAEEPEPTPGEDWTLDQIDARRDEPMPDVPVLPGIADVDQALTEEQVIAAAAPTAGTADAMISVARGLIGTSEHPSGSNHAPPVTTWYGAGDVSWCDESISYEAAHSGNAAAVGGKFAYCPSHTRWFDAHGEWKYGPGDLKPGDVVFFEWSGRRTRDADHVGLVERVLDDGTFYSLEGNTSDVFARRHRDGTYVAGRGRPKYAAAAPSGPAPFPGRYLAYSAGHAMMHGSDVEWVQKRLGVHGHKVTVDDYYGEKTRDAVKAFQKDAHLTVDGIVGPQTWKALAHA